MKCWEIAFTVFLYLWFAFSIVVATIEIIGLVYLPFTWTAFGYTFSYFVQAVTATIALILWRQVIKVGK